MMNVNVMQDLEVEAEAEDQQEVGSQPREWGINTHTCIHVERAKKMQFIYQLTVLRLISLDSPFSKCQCSIINISLTLSQDLQSC